MANGKISGDVTVLYKAGLLVPAVDLTLAAGAQNVKVTAASIAAAGGLATSATIAALRLTPAFVSGPLYLAGYTATADGGEGTFVVVPGDTTSADNGGTIIVDGLGRRWYREIGGGPFSTSWFGVTGNGATDDTAAWQAAINAAIAAKTSLFDPGGKSLISAALNLTGPIHIIGCQQQPITGYALANPMGIGTWFVLDGTHLVSVFRIDTQFGIEIEQFGVYHTQPATHTSWTPAAYPAAISIFNSADIYVHDCTLLNPTVGVAITTSVGGGGRVTLERIRGQPLQQAVVADGLTDVCRFTDLHWWPFWSQDANITAYVQNTGVAYQLGRVDNPIFSGCFAYGYGTGVGVAMTAQGYCNLAVFESCGFDHSKYMVYVSGAGASGHTLKFVSSYSQGFVGNGGSGVVIADTTANNFIEFIGCNIGYNDLSCIAVVSSGTGNNLRFIGGQLWDWDWGSTGAAMATLSTSNNVMVSAETNVFSVNSPGVLIGGTGKVTFIGVPLPGVINGSNAIAGFIGEYVSSSVAVGSGIGFATGASTNVTSINLSAGDWDVTGNIAFAITGGCTAVFAWISKVSATGPTSPNGGAYTVVNSASNINTGTVINAGTLRVNITTPTTVYLSASGAFTTGGVTASGFIGARRVR